MTITTTALDLATRLSMTVEAFGLDADTEVVIFADGSAQADVDGTVQRIDGYNAELMARIAAAFAEAEETAEEAEAREWAWQATNGTHWLAKLETMRWPVAWSPSMGRARREAHEAARARIVNEAIRILRETPANQVEIVDGEITPIED